MNDRTSRRRENDALQSGEDDLAYGQDARDFGEGGQVETGPVTDDEKAQRDVERDASLDPAHQSASSGRKPESGTYERKRGSSR